MGVDDTPKVKSRSQNPAKRSQFKGKKIQIVSHQKTGTWSGMISKVNIDGIKEKCNIFLGGGKNSVGKKNLELDEKFFEKEINLTDRSKSPLPPRYSKQPTGSPINSDSATEDLFVTIKSPVFVKEIQEKDQVKLADFWRISAEKRVQTIKEVFERDPSLYLVDNEFPDNLRSLTHKVHKNEYVMDAKYIKWARLSQIYKSQKIEIFDRDSYHDQNLIGGKNEPYGLTYGLSCLATSNLLLEIFKNQKFNKSGFYHLNVYIGGIKKIVIFDDIVPCSSSSRSSRLEPIFCKMRPFNGKVDIWPQLVLKGLAKYLGCYEKVRSLNTSQLIHMLCPYPFMTLSLYTPKIHDKLSQFLEQKDIVFMSEKSLEGKQPPF